MENLQSFQVIFEFCSAAFSAIMALGVLSTMKYDRKKARIVLGLLITNVVLNIAEALAYIYRGDPSTTGYFMVRITNFTVFFCNILLSALLVGLLGYLIKKNGGKKYIWGIRIAFTILAVSAVILILSRIFHFYYAFDEENRYYRLPSYWLMLGLMESVMLVLVFLTFYNWKYLNLVERIEFLMFEFLPLLGLVIQNFVYGVSVTTIVNTISILLVFLTYELEYSNYMIGKEHQLLIQMVSAFAQAIDAKDPYTGGHSDRVAKYSCMIAEKMGLDKKQVEDIYEMAILHDIGKIGISGQILTKAGKLTDEEYNIIKLHPKIGGDILKKITNKPNLYIGAQWHHERFDGKGYPDGLSGEDIPLQARIIGVADSYDAMTSERSYRPCLTQENVRQEIEKNAGTQFDPEIAKVMLDIIDHDTNYRLRELKDKQVDVVEKNNKNE